MRIDVKKTINTKFAIKEEKGNILYNELKKALEQGIKDIVLDFSEISASTTRFFNVSIGKLYGDFSEKVVDNIKVENANTVVTNQMEVSKNGSKDFYKNKQL
jgi:hypothetical protein